MRNSQNVYLVLKINHQQNSPRLIAKATALKCKSHDQREEMRELQEQIKVYEKEESLLILKEIETSWNL